MNRITSPPPGAITGDGDDRDAPDVAGAVRRHPVTTPSPVSSNAAVTEDGAVEVAAIADRLRHPLVQTRSAGGAAGSFGHDPVGHALELTLAVGAPLAVPSTERSTRSG